MSKLKKVKTKLSVFLKWDFHETFGYKTQKDGDVEYIDSVWCLVCAKHSEKNLKPAEVKGVTQSCSEGFINGTSFVTKHTLDRHLRSGTHKNAVAAESQIPPEDRVVKSLRSELSQVNIETMVLSSSHDAYHRLMVTVYEMALNPSISLRHLETFVDVMRKNGLRFISGKHDGRSAKKLLVSISHIVTERVKNLIDKSNFFGILTDGSQARKTGDDKELVLAKVLRNGSPTCAFADLLEMSNFGGTDAVSLKDGIDSIFKEKGRLSCEYKTKLVSCTSDGASVNTGAKNGLMVKLGPESQRDWLLPIHCVNHRVELACKDALSDSSFQKVQKVYTTLFYLCRNSGAIKSDIKAAAKVLNISFYSFPKLSGTRFISHHRRAMRHLLDMWPAVISALDNTLAIRKHQPKTKGKILGILKKMRSYKYICLASCYLDVLENISPISKVFESNDLMAFDVQENLNITINQLEDVVESTESEEDWDSHLHRFTIIESTTNISSSYVQFGDMLKKPANRKTTTIIWNDFNDVTTNSESQARKEKVEVSKALSETLKERMQSFQEEIFQSMTWMDPKKWETERDYGHTMFNAIYERFKTPLDSAGYNHNKVVSEWRSFRILVKSTYSSNDIATNKITPQKIWKNVIESKRKSFPNLTLLAELIFCISGSNSAVERAFSLLTVLLTDRRMKLKHETMVLYMNIKCNDHLWDEVERKEIIKEAVQFHLRVKRKRAMDVPDARAEAVEINEENYGSESDENVEDSEYEFESSEEEELNNSEEEQSDSE